MMNLNQTMEDQKDTSVKLVQDIWGPFIKSFKNIQYVAPVHFFKHAPFSSFWDKFAPKGALVEMPLRLNGKLVQVDKQKINWVAKIYMYAGYKALCRFLPHKVKNEAKPGPTPSSSTVTIEKGMPVCLNFLSADIYPLGYSRDNRIILHPTGQTNVVLPHVGKRECAEIFDSLITIPIHRSTMILNEGEKRMGRFRLGEIVEAANIVNGGVYRLGKINVKVGDRVCIVFFDEVVEKNEKVEERCFWVSQHSPHLHKLGWCKIVKATLCGGSTGNKALYNKKEKTSTSAFGIPYTPPYVLMTIKEKMIFEMRHPMFPHKMCAGWVVQVLECGYIIAGTDWTRPDGSAKVVLHACSDYILPLGFCQEHGIPLEMPTNVGDSRSWMEYLLRFRLQQFPMFAGSTTPHKFTKGCKLEAIKIIEPEKVHPATVVKVAGRLIQIHFDGCSRTDEKSFQWVSCDSTDIYPLGYAEMVNHPVGNNLPDEIDTDQLTSDNYIINPYI